VASPDKTPLERPNLERIAERPDVEDWSGQAGTLMVHAEARLARYALSLEAEVVRLREALQEIAQGGVWDAQTYAKSTLEHDAKQKQEDERPPPPPHPTKGTP